MNRSTNRLLTFPTTFRAKIRRSGAAIGGRDHLRGFVIPVGGQAVVAGEGRDPAQRVERPREILDGRAVVAVVFAGG